MGNAARAFLLFLILGLLAAQTAAASIEVPFTTRFAANLHGDVTIAANTLMTCPAGEGECTAARAGTASGAAQSNNAYKMEFVDNDSDNATFDSSSASLALPAGATVRFAGLYFGGRTSAEGGGTVAPDASKRGTVLFQAPGAPGYSTLTGSVADSDPKNGIPNAYGGFADVTAAVAAAGAGVYTVADVQAGTGKDRYAGWSLVVAYADPASPPRSLRVFDGLAAIQSGDPPLQIAVGGLETPPAGVVKASVGLVAYEGDRSGTGDRLSFAGKPLFDAANPEKNVFNSTIAANGVDVTTKAPNFDNQLGFDADLFDANGFLGNEVTSTTLEETTNIEQYLTQALAVSIELDPEVLEPPPPPPPPVQPVPPTPPVPPMEEPGKGNDKPEVPKLDLEVAVSDRVVRPTEVVAIEVEVDSTGEKPVRGVEVCSRLPEGLRLLAAPKATIEDDEACWDLPKLAGGESRTFHATAIVDAAQPRTLTSTTTVRAGNARTRRVKTRFRVVPLRAGACGSASSSAAEPDASASC